MRKSLTTAVCAVILLSSSRAEAETATSSPGSAVEQALIALEKKFDVARLKGDTSVVADVRADDFVQVIGMGVRTKAGQLKGGQASKGVTACTLFTAAEIRQITATKPSPIDQMKTEESPLPGGGSECDVAGFGIQIDAVPVARFEANREAFSTRAKYERVADVADAAYFYEQGAGTSVPVVGVYARTAAHVFVISNIVGMNESVADLRPQLLALGKAAAAKLR